jgi:cysteine desulfurase
LAYFDHNATTPVRESVLEAMRPYFRERFGNSSSVHAYGRDPREKKEEAREQVAALLGCAVGEVVFTSGGTESDNAAIKGVFFALREKGRHIVTTAVEHHAVLHSCRYLEERFGCRVSCLPVDGNGLVDPEAIGAAITPETVLVTVMMANNETGSVNAIADIGKVTRAQGVLFHTDAVQAVGKIPIDVNDLGVDLLSLSGHKFYGPKGMGALYVRTGTSLDPFVHGGGHEGGRRAGTENIPGIVGLGQAAESARVELEEERKRQEDLRDYFWRRIDESIPDVRLNGHPTMRLPNTLNVSFPRLEGESALLMLDNSGVAISTGSACSSEELEPSHVLTAMGVDNLSARGALRFSLGRENTREEIDAAMELLPGIIARLREMSPL